MTASIKIDGIMYTADTNDTILEAARKNGISIPSLCFMKDCNKVAACRMCVVEVTGMKALPPACVTRCREGMEIFTDSQRVRESRRMTLDQLASHHRMVCDRCSRYSDCEFHALCVDYGISERDYNPYKIIPEKDESALHLVRDYSKCLSCNRCVAACHNQEMDILSSFKRGWEKKIGPAKPLGLTDCIGCGQCVTACPTGALSIRDDTAELRNIIRQRKKHVIAILTPSTAKAFPRLFYEEERDCSGKLVSMLRKLGFERVYSSVPTQNDYISREIAMEDVISEACPGIRNLIEKLYPEKKSSLSGLGSLQSYSARIARRTYSAETGISEDDILAVYINSCTAGKTENVEGLRTLTTYELAGMFRRACVSRFTAMKVWREQLDENAPFDSLPEAKAVSVETVTGTKNAKEALRNWNSGYLKCAACPGGCDFGGGSLRKTSPNF